MPSPEVARILHEGHAAWPELAVPHAIHDLIQDRIEGEAEPLVADEIYLACACALGDSAAVEAFERRYFALIPAVLSRLSLGPDQISEIQQILRIRLFVAEAGCVAPVVAYAGRGQLGGLVRVAALRAGLNLLRDRGRLAGDDFEDQHRVSFKAAFEEAIRDLPARQRSLLGLTIVRRLGIDRIGVIYGVHRATAARWIVQARDDLARSVRRLLGRRLGVPDAEVGDVVPLVASQLELSLERLLASKTE
jgi:RNA polymerase sigma-70 factor (ECF subfamily)